MLRADLDRNVQLLMSSFQRRVVFLFLTGPLFSPPRQGVRKRAVMRLLSGGYKVSWGDTAIPWATSGKAPGGGRWAGTRAGRKVPCAGTVSEKGSMLLLSNTRTWLKHKRKCKGEGDSQRSRRSGGEEAQGGSDGGDVGEEVDVTNEDSDG